MNSSKSLSSLHLYPIKSCQGITLDEVSVGPKGPGFDRRWMVVDASGRFLSIRNTPRMIFIETVLDKDFLRLRIPHEAEYSIRIKEAGQGGQRIVTVWKDTCEAIDQGDDIASALSRFLGVECRLVFMPDTTHRQVDQQYAVTPQDSVGFADAYPALLISEASLEELNRRLESPVLMNRFRPNFVIAGCTPHEEDTWKSIRIGNVHFSVVKPCSRCVAITVDSATGEKGQEPMQALMTYRLQEKKILFGVNLIPTSQGRVQTGDVLEVLQY